MMEAIYSLLAVVADRLRGSGIPNTKSIFQLLLAVAVGLLIDIPLDWVFVAFVILFVLGAAPGWGNPVSAFLRNEPMKPDYEFWQRGILRRSRTLALVSRGVIWGLPMSILYFWYPQVLTVSIAYMIAFYLSALFARALYATQKNNQCTWGHMEWLRGIIAMLIINFLLITFFI